MNGTVIKRETAATVSLILRGGTKTETETETGGKKRGRRGKVSSSKAEETAQTGARETIWWMKEKKYSKIWFKMEEGK